VQSGLNSNWAWVGGKILKFSVVLRERSIEQYYRKTVSGITFKIGLNSNWALIGDKLLKFSVGLWERSIEQCYRKAVSGITFKIWTGYCGGYQMKRFWFWLHFIVIIIAILTIKW
jgi:hypothetical protein